MVPLGHIAASLGHIAATLGHIRGHPGDFPLESFLRMKVATVGAPFNRSEHPPTVYALFDNSRLFTANNFSLPIIQPSLLVIWPVWRLIPH